MDCIATRSKSRSKNYHQTKRRHCAIGRWYHDSSWGCILYSIFFIYSFQNIPSCFGQICQPVFPETLSRLNEILGSQGSSYKVICRFTISHTQGQCDTTEPYKIKSAMNVVCRPEYGSTEKCIIDCPNTHFQIEPSAIAQFSGFEFRSATTSAIQVLSNGIFYSRNNVFSHNGSQDRGGAIYAHPNSGMSIVFTTFESNYAKEGGAIYIANKGVNVYTASTVLGNTFAGNYAEVGGAIYIDERVKFTFMKNTFVGNYSYLLDNDSSSKGPAIFYAGFVAKYSYGNYGCDNGKALCDGAWNSATQKCEPFDSVCIYHDVTEAPSPPTDSPTKAPSSMPSSNPSAAPTISKVPTNAPSVSPSLSPNETPSLIPTSTPTILPTAVPTYSKQPSLFPTDAPTKAPSSMPSSNPSTAPTISKAPTNAPSVSPSLGPNATPSLMPTSTPTILPTAVPTYSKQPSSPPTNIHSKFPSNDPTAILSNVPSTIHTQSLPSVPTNSHDANDPTEVTSGPPTI